MDRSALYALIIKQNKRIQALLALIGTIILFIDLLRKCNTIIRKKKKVQKKG